jgi:hypothetical protein
MFCLVGFDSGVFDAQCGKQLVVLLFQFVPMDENKNLPLCTPSHLGEQIGLPCPAGGYDENTAVAPAQSLDGFLIEILLVIP